MTKEEALRKYEDRIYLVGSELNLEVVASIARDAGLFAPVVYRDPFGYFINGYLIAVFDVPEEVGDPEEDIEEIWDLCKWLVKEKKTFVDPSLN